MLHARSMHRPCHTRLALGDRLYLGIPLGLALEALLCDQVMRRCHLDLVDRLLLPVVTIAKLLNRLPARKDIPGQVVVQIDQAGRDDAAGMHHARSRRQRHMCARRHNPALLHQHGSVLDYRLRHHQRSGQRDGCLLSLRGQRKKVRQQDSREGNGQNFACVAASLPQRRPTNQPTRTSFLTRGLIRTGAPQRTGLRY